MFIPATMIHLTVKIKGVAVKFLVDTGAQISLLPRNVALATNLDDLVDEKYHGVGKDKIRGKIHYVEIELPCGVLRCAKTMISNHSSGST